MILSEFEIQYVERKLIKRLAIMDQLVEAPITDHQPLDIEFPNESILLLTDQS